MKVAPLIVLLVAIGGARLLGFEAFVVTSGSMEPSIAVGSLILVQAVRPDSVGVGDVITYALPDRTVTHRVEGISQQDGRVAFVTRGDANDVADPWLAEPRDEVGAVRATVPLLGLAVAAIQSWWRAIAAALLAWLLIEWLTGQVRERGPRAAMRRPAHV
jgi:signal peptidase